MRVIGIMAAAIADTLGRPEAWVLRRLLPIAATVPGTWFDVVPDEEARAILAQLHEEREGILAWLVKGAVEARREWGLP